MARVPSGKSFLSFKKRKNIKIADLDLTMNSFYDKDDILQNNVKMQLKTFNYD